MKALFLTLGFIMIAKAHSIEYIAHRGLSSEFRENSINAINNSLNKGFNYLEVDLHRTKDGHVVAIHDYSVDRTTNSTGAVVDLTLKELKTIDSQIPTLSEILTIINSSDLKLILEIKNKNNIYPGIETNIYQITEKYSRDRIIYKSFSRKVLDRFFSLNSKNTLLYVTIGKLWKFPLYIDDWLRIGSIFDYDKANLIQVHKSFLSKAFIKEAHALGKKIIVWDIQNYKSYLRAKDLKVDMIETDYPPASLTEKPSFSK